MLLSISFNSSCQNSNDSVKNISADSLNSMLKNSDAIILDVRTPQEFAEGHIPGAININFHDPGFEAALDTLNKEKQYEVYCRSGNRSGKSIDLMTKKGFKRIHHLKGGMLEWEEKGFDLVK